MLLVIDIGNTDLTIGLFEADNLLNSWRLATDQHRLKDEYGIQLSSLLKYAGISSDRLEGVAVSSVVPHLTHRLTEACQQYLHTTPLIISPHLKMPITLGYDDPLSVGSDRIADAVAVQTRYGGPACIIDFGTATTFNALSKDRVYLGGAITTGLQVSTEALIQRAAKLQPIEWQIPSGVIGKNTAHAMQSGILFGYACLVSGMITLFKKELGENARVIATGGLVNIISPLVPEIDIADQALTMDGIRILWELNHPQPTKEKK